MVEPQVDWWGTLKHFVYVFAFYAIYHWTGFENFIAIMAIFVLFAIHDLDTVAIAIHTDDQEDEDDQDDYGPRSESWDDLPDSLKEHGNEGI